MDLLDSPEFATQLAKSMEDQHVPGMNIAIYQNERIVAKGFGHASIESKMPMAADMVFNIASCSKSFTAGLVGLAIDDERFPDVKWTSIVSSLLPGEFVMSDQMYTDNVNIDDIVSHRTGLPGYDLALFGPRSSHPDTAKTVTNRLRDLNVNAPLRTKFQYNNFMFSVAAYLYQHLTGLSFPDALREKIFQPLGMTSSFVHISGVPSQLRPRAVTGHNWVEGEGYTVVEPVDQPEGDGAGCIITSVEDHIKWIKAFIDKDGPITSEIYKELVRPRMIDDSWDNKRHPFTSADLYAAGWYSRYYRGHEIIYHSGSDMGFGSMQFFMPDLKFGGVLHGNSEAGTDLTFAVGLQLIDEVLGVPVTDRPDWVALVQDDNSDKKDDDDDDEEDQDKDKPRSDEPQTRSLDLYTGTFWNAGYKEIKVEIKDGNLFIDASDRGYPFELTLEHVSAQTNYRAKWRSYDTGYRQTIKAKFEFGGERAMKVGVVLDIDDMIWFVREET